MNKTRNKRIVLLVPSFPKTSETFIVSKFLGLLERGWDVHLVCIESDSKEWAKFPVLDADPTLRERVHRAWPTTPKWLAVTLWLPALIRGLVLDPSSTWRYLVKGCETLGWKVFKHYYIDLEVVILQPDVVHFEFGALAVGKTYLKELLGSKLTVSFRGYDLNFSGLDQPAYYEKVWQQVDACHFLGQDLWKRALRRGCPPDMTYQLIPPAIDLSLFHPDGSQKYDSLGTPDNPLRILSVGRLEWKKGYEFALQAIRILVDHGVSVEYQIIGEGGHSNALYFARHQLDLDDDVVFYGSLPSHEVIKHLERADIFLHSAVSEGFCNAVLEAQAMGIPIVSTDADGLAENVADGVTGFVVARRDPQAIAEKLMLLAKNPSLRRTMGTAGRKRVQSHFQLENQLRDFESFYEMVLAEHQGKGGFTEL